MVKILGVQKIGIAIKGVIYSLHEISFYHKDALKLILKPMQL